MQHIVLNKKNDAYNIGLRLSKQYYVHALFVGCRIATNRFLIGQLWRQLDTYIRLLS